MQCFNACNLVVSEAAVEAGMAGKAVSKRALVVAWRKQKRQNGGQWQKTSKDVMCNCLDDVFKKNRRASKLHCISCMILRTEMY